MFKLARYAYNPVLGKNHLVAWEAGSVLNPCVIKDGDIFRMFYRATNDTKPGKSGGYVSSIGYAESRDGISWVRSAEPVLRPGEPYDKDGCEDARVTKIAGVYYMHYTAVSQSKGGEWRVRIALATSTDAKTWTKHAIVGPSGSWSKAATLFPEQIRGKYWWLYTWEADRPQSSIMSIAADSLADVVSPPVGQVARTLEDFDTWVVFAPPDNTATFRGAEVGAPPIRTDSGWLLIYCAANTTTRPEWAIKAALLDLDDPRHVIAETPGPILEPETAEELEGVVSRVTFPEGAVVVGEELYVYYGSGDQGCCLATCKLDELLGYLRKNKCDKRFSS